MLKSIELTKRGLPALWEKGGGFSNTGEATIIANGEGSPKKPVYIRTKGPLANAEHALFVIRPGDIVIQAWQHRGDFEIDVYRIARIDVQDKTAELERIHRFSEGEWDVTPPESLGFALNSAMSKANHYHCREPHYFLESVSTPV